MTLSQGEDMGAYLADVRQRALAVVPAWHPTLRDALDQTLPTPLGVFHMLPLIGVRASGGDLGLAAPLLVAWSHLLAAVRIFDDCADNDNPRAFHNSVGVDRAYHLAAALLPQWP